jgi:hypothetical protein
MNTHGNTKQQKMRPDRTAAGELWKKETGFGFFEETDAI